MITIIIFLRKETSSSTHYHPHIKQEMKHTSIQLLLPQYANKVYAGAGKTIHFRERYIYQQQLKK